MPWYVLMLQILINLVWVKVLVIVGEACTTFSENSSMLRCECSLLYQDWRTGTIYRALVCYEVRNSSREAFAPLGVSKTHPTNSVHG